MDPQPCSKREICCMVLVVVLGHTPMWKVGCGQRGLGGKSKFCSNRQTDRDRQQVRVITDEWTKASHQGCVVWHHACTSAAAAAAGGQRTLQ